MPFPCSGQFVALKWILQMFSTNHDDKHAVHEKMKRRVQAFICEITQKGQQMGLETVEGAKEIRINNEWHLQPPLGSSIGIPPGKHGVSIRTLHSFSHTGVGCCSCTYRKWMPNKARFRKISIRYKETQWKWHMCKIHTQTHKVESYWHMEKSIFIYNTVCRRPISLHSQWNGLHRCT